MLRARGQSGSRRRIARATGLDPTPIVVEAKRPIWAAVNDICAAHDVEAVVAGSRGLSGVKSILLGSVSNGILHHATRPIVIVRRSVV